MAATIAGVRLAVAIRRQSGRLGELPGCDLGGRHRFSTPTQRPRLRYYKPAPHSSISTETAGRIFS